MYKNIAKNKCSIIVLTAIKFCSVIFATFIFARFTPLVDSEMYISGEGLENAVFRTKIISFFAAYFAENVGDTVTHFIFALFSCAGAFLYYIKGGRGWEVIAVFLLPSSMVWTSVVGKEAVFVGFFSISIVLWVKFVVSHLSVHEWFLCVISILGACIFRPHYALVLFWLFYAAFVVIHGLKWRKLIIVLSFFLLISVVYVTVWDEILLRGFGGIEPLARASRFDVLGIEPRTMAGFEKFKRTLIYAWSWGIIGPLPVEVIDRPILLPFFIEGIFVLLFPFLMFVVACRLGVYRSKKFLEIYLLVLIPAVIYLVAIHSPFGILNPGSATRWRTNFEPGLVLAPLLLVMTFQRRMR